MAAMVTAANISLTAFGTQTNSILSPALYKIAQPEWIPDVDYNVNEFYLLDGDKFSTSRRHAIWGKDILGNSYADVNVDSLPRVPTATYQALSDVADNSFWSPYN